MSYLDPRAGQNSGDTYAEPAYQNPAWHADERAPDPMNHADEKAPDPMNSDDESRRGPGKRRAGRGRKPEGKSRAGRNLPAAIAVGLSLGLVVLASLLVWSPALLGVVVLAAGVGVWETSRALSVTGARPPVIPLIAGTAVMTGLAWYEGADALTVGLVVTIGAAVLWRLADGVAAVRRDFTSIVLIAVYVPFLLSFAAMLVRPEDDGQWRVLATVVAVVLSDTGGYAAGVFLGKHPMAPKISPKKSWEGFAGSITASAIGSGALLFFLMHVPVYYGLLFGAVLSVVAVLGDLAESMLKRDLGIKDMSNLLPGHGGLMDRLDSILFAVPTAYLLFAIIAPN
ncbi:phosphatidate cytidylyltransferase [Actinoplanes sp. SE50]|uniref:phosphatidate cytidylyltransferase n=1 Tax=unclassified Actinoplanes TaxID=2626549 RepID=UPI00023EBFF4|nr:MULTISPECIES: phosphatidate cytidylyltransferase [unclassified Actinoplanes]AEV88137.1 phosphatidate cytidylyltransferase [Actinoplanes sp. SE50/110]ATO86542.1 phosphatidate cytidylyltransferase [Actinoplanes sp. SE50]SLM03959.1 phosphatidate cytidylyltransferase [Actinoplanes sp. SE50/110]